MVRRANGLRNGRNKSKVDAKVRVVSFDYHEGLSPNQVKIVLREFRIEHLFDEFSEWMRGQTCPIIIRHNRDTGEQIEIGGVYEYDLFRWIANQKKGTPLVWD